MYPVGRMGTLLAYVCGAYHQNDQLQGFGLLTFSDLRFSRTDPSISSVDDLFIFFVQVV
jgi:hypothetical protein